MALSLTHERIWLDKSKYECAEYRYYQYKTKEAQTPLACEVGRVREWLTNMKNNIEEPSLQRTQSKPGPTQVIEVQLNRFETILLSFEEKLNYMDDRIKQLEEASKQEKVTHTHPVNLSVVNTAATTTKGTEDDIDLFGSDSEDDEKAVEIRQARLADYEAKKSKKPTLIAKSNIILDIKPWDDETDMKLMEQAVRAIQTDGLVWGAAKLVPLAYGIYKLQISCVVEDDLVSVDWLQEKIEEMSDYVQSVDIAAFNKV